VVVIFVENRAMPNTRQKKRTRRFCYALPAQEVVLISTVPSYAFGPAQTPRFAKRVCFIYFNFWNKATAPTWRLGFNQEVYDRVQRFSYSPSQ
jgi:hypothetical protein